MAEYVGNISGIGNPTTRENEITADSVASLRNFIIGTIHGVVNSGGKFEAEILSKSRIKINKGTSFAYGYFGSLVEPVVFDLLLPSNPQYMLIYCEFDRSRLPNTYKIKIKNNQSSPYVNENTFRQDVLSSVKTGVFQEPLYLLEVSSTGIEIQQDLRQLKSYIRNVGYATQTARITGWINDGTSISPLNTNIGTNPAWCEFVVEKVSEEINK